MLFEETMLLTFGAQYQRIPPFVEGYFEIGGVSILNQHFFTAGASICYPGRGMAIIVKDKTRQVDKSCGPGS